MVKYAAVCKVGAKRPFLATFETSLIVGTESDLYKVFGDLIIQLVPIHENTKVSQIWIREHSPGFFKDDNEQSR